MNNYDQYQIDRYITYVYVDKKSSESRRGSPYTRSVLILNSTVDTIRKAKSISY